MSKELKYPRIVLGLLSTIPVLIVLLVGLWLYSYATIPTLPVSYVGGNLLAYDSDRGYVAKPNSHIRWLSKTVQDFDVFTDGRSGRTDGPKPAPSHADVVIVGCSISWGAFVQDDKTFAAKLGPNVENLAMASYGTVQAFQSLKRNLDLRPKLIIYGFISDHLRRNVLPCAPSYYPFCLDVSHVAFDPLSIEPPLSDGVARASIHVDGPGLTGWLPHGIDVAIARYRKAWADSHVPGPEKQVEALTFALGEMSKAAQSIEARLVVVNIPSRDEDKMNEGLAQAASKLGITVIDTTPAFLEHRKTENLYVSDGHLSEAGHSVVADELRAVMKDLNP